MRIDFVTLFPEMFSGPLDLGIVGRARESGRLETGFFNPRDFSTNRHKKVDDRPFGGGVGMVMMAEPLSRAIESAVQSSPARVVYLSPQGRRFSDAHARRLSRESHLVLVCGRYEGIDQRTFGLFDEEISIGDYVLTGGELPAMVVAEAVSRLIPGVLKEEATALESFASDGLDFPQYTRPRVWRGKAVPDVLLSGDHEKISNWRLKEAAVGTARKRPDLLEKRGKIR